MDDLGGPQTRRSPRVKQGSALAASGAILGLAIGVMPAAAHTLSSSVHSTQHDCVDLQAFTDDGSPHFQGYIYHWTSACNVTPLDVALGNLSVETEAYKVGSFCASFGNNPNTSSHRYWSSSTGNALCGAGDYIGYVTGYHVSYSWQIYTQGHSFK